MAKASLMLCLKAFFGCPVMSIGQFIFMLCLVDGGTDTVKT
jgi:hypothetical protein